MLTWNSNNIYTEDMYHQHNLLTGYTCKLRFVSSVEWNNDIF